MIFVSDNGLSFRSELDIHHEKHEGDACRKNLFVSQAGHPVSPDRGRADLVNIEIYPIGYKL